VDAAAEECVDNADRNTSAITSSIMFACDAGECVDQFPKMACESYRQVGYCDPTSEYYSYAKENCLKTCG